jgi:hypothetical protein
MTAAITQAVADAGNGAWPHPEFRACVLTLEVPDGAWGGDGRIILIPDIYEIAWLPRPGAQGGPRETAEQVLATSRRGQAEMLVAASDREAVA